jgi:viroplasmin and RNaseH domain-containing protein
MENLTVRGVRGVIPKTQKMKNNIEEFEFKRKEQLENYRIKQPYRVAIGKNQWIPYEQFNPAYNLREILNDEIVIEFDTDNKNIAWEGINFTGVNLYRAGITFQIWNHNGKSPHLHIHNLPIAQLEADKRRLFKKIFIRKYVPKDYLPYVDLSLTGIHLIAIEWQTHWKGCYGIKQLLHKFNPLHDSQEVNRDGLLPDLIL